MLVNERISVRWSVDQVSRWYEGVVVSYDPVKALHLVHYDDG